MRRVVLVGVLVLAACSASPKPALRNDAQLCAVLGDDLPGTAGEHRTVVDLLTVWPDVPAGRGDLAVVIDGSSADARTTVARVPGVTGARVGPDGDVYADVPTVTRRAAVARRIRSITGVTDVRDTNAGATGIYAAYGLAPRAAQRAWTEILRKLDGAGKGDTKRAIGTVLDAHLDLMSRLVRAPVTDLVADDHAVFSEKRWQKIVAASATVDRFASRTCARSV